MTTPPEALAGVALRRNPAGFVFEADGFFHPRSVRGRGRRFTRYADVTHVAASEKRIWIATRRSVRVLSREVFVERGDAERVLREVLRRIAALPDGGERMRRIAALEERAERAGPPTATRSLALACVLIFLVQVAFDPVVYMVGHFNPLLVRDGDLWRVFTANLLHAFPLHLLLNGIGLLLIGPLAERALGGVGAICVMGAAAVGSMLASGLLVPESVVGVSGIVFGLVGATAWLELRCGAALPAWWRFPRHLVGLLVVAFALDVALGFTVTLFAGEAHVGGFVAGLLAAAWLTPGGELPAPEGSRGARVAGAIVACSLVSLLAAAVEVARVPDYATSYARRLAQLPGVAPGELNDHAWLIAIDPDASRGQLEIALELAERAVAETGGEEATLLDTLAEVLFQLGRGDEAIAVIDRAIAREPGEAYYREQRRRFTGERAADDRPPDPALEPFWREPPPAPPALPADADGLTA